jgi:hypothetical protein
MIGSSTSRQKLPIGIFVPDIPKIQTTTAQKQNLRAHRQSLNGPIVPTTQSQIKNEEEAKLIASQAISDQFFFKTFSSTMSP